MTKRRCDVALTSEGHIITVDFGRSEFVIERGYVVVAISDGDFRSETRMYSTSSLQFARSVLICNVATKHALRSSVNTTCKPLTRALEISKCIFEDEESYRRLTVLAIEHGGHCSAVSMPALEKLTDQCLSDIEASPYTLELINHYTVRHTRAELKKMAPLIDVSAARVREFTGFGFTYAVHDKRYKRFVAVRSDRSSKTTRLYKGPDDGYDRDYDRDYNYPPFHEYYSDSSSGSSTDSSTDSSSESSSDYED